MTRGGHRIEFEDDGISGAGVDGSKDGNPRSRSICLFVCLDGLGLFGF